MEKKATDFVGKLASDADLCVRCGLCLAHCPTYSLRQNEGDSPRGRIALMGAFAANQIPVDTGLVSHLDGCLGCGRCEAECPVEVPYMKMIDATRTALRERGVELTSIPKWLDRLVRAPLLLRLAGVLLRLFVRFGGGLVVPHSWLARKFPRWFRMVSMLPPQTVALPKKTAHCKGKVALFTGCMAAEVDAQTVVDSQHLLSAVGYEVVIPKRQVCCGGLHRHYGVPQSTKAFQAKNSSVFSQAEVLVSCASGCGRELSESQESLGVAHEDVNVMLLRRVSTLRFNPWEGRPVVLHLPCTMRKLPKEIRQAPEKLLFRVPGLRVAVPTTHHGCCGAAGLHTIAQPETADQMASALLGAPAFLNTDLLLTTNFGCAVHLRQLLRRSGRTMEVLHPVTLLARQLTKEAP